MKWKTIAMTAVLIVPMATCVAVSERVVCVEAKP